MPYTSYQQLGPYLFIGTGGSKYQSPRVTESGIRSNTIYSWRSSEDRRKKPVGIELLFSSQSYSNSRTTTTDCVVALEDGNFSPSRMLKPVGTSWSLGVGIDDNVMSVNLRNKIKDQHVNLAVALGEYRQTADLFATNALRVYKAYKALRKGDVKRVRSFIDRKKLSKMGVKLPPKKHLASNLWLEFQYGVMPLVCDVKGSIDQMVKEADRPERMVYSFCQKAKSRRFEQSSYEYTYRRFTTCTSEENLSRHLLAHVMYENSVSNSVARVGFGNPLAVAWELLPYSFVIDWFVNVGDWISSLDALSGTSRVYVTRTTKDLYEMTNGLGATYRIERTSRDVNVPLEVGTPRWNPSLSWRRCVSAVALLRQRS